MREPRCRSLLFFVWEEFSRIGQEMLAGAQGEGCESLRGRYRVCRRVGEKNLEVCVGHSSWEELTLANRAAEVSHTEERRAMAKSLLPRASRAVLAPGGICEKASKSIFSRHPGDRDRDDLLGQRAQRPVAIFIAVVGARSITADAANAADTVAGDAACLAADTEQHANT